MHYGRSVDKAIDKNMSALDKKIRSFAAHHAIKPNTESIEKTSTSPDNWMLWTLNLTGTWRRKETIRSEFYPECRDGMRFSSLQSRFLLLVSSSLLFNFEVYSILLILISLYRDWRSRRFCWAIDSARSMEISSTWERIANQLEGRVNFHKTRQWNVRNAISTRVMTAA